MCGVFAFNLAMLGAIAGDMIGSVYEFYPTKSTDFPLFVPDSRFTDDTVLTVAVADCLLNSVGYIDKFHEYTLAYPHRAYGLGFYNWVHSGSREAYYSWGNGSAMRVSPIAYAFETLEKALHEAKASAEVTHNHPEGIRGAIAVTMAIFMARRGESKDEIRRAVHGQVGDTTSDEPPHSFARPTSSTSPARVPSQRLSPLFSTQRTTKTRSGWPSRWAETPTRSPASRASSRYRQCPQEGYDPGPTSVADTCFRKRSPNSGSYVYAIRCLSGNWQIDSGSWCGLLTACARIVAAVQGNA